MAQAAKKLDTISTKVFTEPIHISLWAPARANASG
jgi:hypothetical protein